MLYFCLFTVADIELATKLLRQASTGAESLLNPIGQLAAAARMYANVRDHGAVFLPSAESHLLAVLTLSLLCLL